MLTVRHRIGLNLAPLLLRIVVGGIFIWAGLAKVGDGFNVQGNDAAILASLGVIHPASPSPAPAPRATPTTPPAPSEPVTVPKTKPTETKPSDAKPAEKAGGHALAPLEAFGSLEAAAQTAGTPAPARAYTAADFPDPIRVLYVYQLALTLHNASHPSLKEDGTRPMRLWPIAIGEGAWPVRFAWLAAITELVGGACVLLGLVTRLAAFSLAGVMLVAAWLTQFGPAIQSGNNILGFIPNHGVFDLAAWQSFWVQACLFVMALSLVSLGSGRLGLDHIVLGSRDDDDLD
jgi:uncharacterized membrane protein YphA (DoxX/SURF4 family)